MQFMVSVIHDKANDGTPEEQAAITAFNARLHADGNWVFAGGLSAPTAATVIDNRDEKPIFTDGPFVESKEFIAGLWILEAPDLEMALALATEGSKACHRRLEVRPFL